MRRSSHRLATWSTALVMGSLLGSCTFAFNLDSLQAECASTEKRCGNECVPRNQPETGCGNEKSCAPCAIIGSNTKCDESDRCAADECYFPYGNCNDSPLDGCEANLATDIDNCGRCNLQACAGPPAFKVQKPACIGAPELPDDARCGIASCELGWGDCDHDPKTGCETPLDSSSTNCGACDQSCGNNEACLQSKCVSTIVP